MLKIYRILLQPLWKWFDHAIDQKFLTTVIFKSDRLQLKIVCQRSFKARANYWCNLSITVSVQIIWNDDSSSQNWYSFYLKTRLIRAICGFNFNNVYCFKYITLTNKERSTSTGKKYLRVHLLLLICYSLSAFFPIRFFSSTYLAL